MVIRRFWIERIEQALKKRSLLWLSGVRRTGKTTLCQSLHGSEYFDCELPSVRRQLDDPESFWKSLGNRQVVLDEIHRLGNPSEILKIAADHFPGVKVIATGSSSLGASARFRDTLTGRKTELWLTPLVSADLEDFQQPDLPHRFLHGGLPPFFLAPEAVDKDFQEWMDAYWAKDIQELFRLERRHSFERFVELLLAQSGGLFEATRFARACEISRGTIVNYLAVLENTFVMHVIRPFSTYRPTEIVAAPKVYGFDTGFVCVYSGWDRLRPADFGRMWEHYVLNELHGVLQRRDIRYWRDKQGHEVDFVLTHRKQPPLALECKWKVTDFDPASLRRFHALYPDAHCAVVANNVERIHSRSYGDLTVHFYNLSQILEYLQRT